MDSPILTRDQQKAGVPYFSDKIKKALASNSVGFTLPLRNHPARYIVGLTNNTEPTFDTLNSQALDLSYTFKQLNVGGWTNSRGTRFVDISTSTDNLSTAKALGKAFKQQCIWDTKEQEEIKV